MNYVRLHTYENRHYDFVLFTIMIKFISHNIDIISVIGYNTESWLRVSIICNSKGLLRQPYLQRHHN